MASRRRLVSDGERALNERLPSAVLTSFAPGGLFPGQQVAGDGNAMVEAMLDLPADFPVKGVFLAFQIPVHQLGGPIQGPQDGKAAHQGAQVAYRTLPAAVSFALDVLEKLRIRRGLAGDERGYGPQLLLVCGCFLKHLTDGLHWSCQRIGVGRRCTYLQFMGKKMVQVVEMVLLSLALGKSGAKNGVELPFIQGIDQTDLKEAILGLGGGDAQIRGASAGDKLQNCLFHG